MPCRSWCVGCWAVLTLCRLSLPFPSCMNQARWVPTCWPVPHSARAMVARHWGILRPLGLPSPPLRLRLPGYVTAPSVPSVEDEPPADLSAVSDAPYEHARPLTQADLALVLKGRCGGRRREPGCSVPAQRHATCLPLVTSDGHSWLRPCTLSCKTLAKASSPTASDLPAAPNCPVVAAVLGGGRRGRERLVAGQDHRLPPGRAQLVKRLAGWQQAESIPALVARLCRAGSGRGLMPPGADFANTLGALSRCRCQRHVCK